MIRLDTDIACRCEKTRCRTDEIDLINQVLSAVPADGNMTVAVRQWIVRVLAVWNTLRRSTTAPILELSSWRDNLNVEKNHDGETSRGQEGKD